MTLDDKLDILIKSQEDILKRIEILEERLETIHKDTQKMDNHIDFIESIYSKIKSPFHMLMNTIASSQRIFGNNIQAITNN